MTSQSPQGPAPYGLRGPGGNRTCIAIYSTPAVEYVFKPRRRVRQRLSCVSTVPPQPLGAGGSRTRTTCVTGFDVLQQAVGDVLFSRDRRGLGQRRFGALPLSYGATGRSQNCAGGTRTHNNRVMSHVLQPGSRSVSDGRRSGGQSAFQYGNRTRRPDVFQAPDSLD